MNDSQETEMLVLPILEIRYLYVYEPYGTMMELRYLNVYELYGTMILGPQAFCLALLVLFDLI